MTYRRTWTDYDGLMPVPPHLWQRTILSPFFRVPFPSQFLHGFFFSPMLFRIQSSKFERIKIRRCVAATKPSPIGSMAFPSPRLPTKSTTFTNPQISALLFQFRALSARTRSLRRLAPELA